MKSYEQEFKKLVETHGIDAVKSAVEILWNKPQTQHSCMRQVSGGK